MTRKRTGKPNASNVVCIDNKGKGWKRHLFTVNAYCGRCRIWARDWQQTAARRRAGELLAGRGGEIVELNGKANAGNGERS